MGLWVCCFYTALIFIRPQDWIAWLQPLPLLDLAAGIAMLALLQQFSRHSKHLLGNPQVVLLLLFWATAVASFVAQFFLSEVLATFTIVGKTVFAMVLIVATVTDRRKLHVLCVLLLLAFGFHALHCSLQWYTGVGLGGIVPGYRWSSHGPVIQVCSFGIFNNPNDVGAIMVMGIVIAISLCREYRGQPLVTAVLVAYAAWLLQVIFWTNSRQSIIYLAIGVFALFFRPTRRHSLIAAALTLVVLVAGVTTSVRWQGRLGDDRSARRRAAAMTGALQVFKAHPLLGVGRERAYDAVGMHMPLHNSYVQVLAETGIVGFAAYLTLILVSLLQTLHAMRGIPETAEERRDVAHARLFFALTLVVAVSSYFRNRSYQVDVFVLFGLTAAFACNMARRYGAQLPAYFHSSWLWRRGLLVSGGVTVGALGALYLTSFLFWRLFG